MEELKEKTAIKEDAIKFKVAGGRESPISDLSDVLHEKVSEKVGNERKSRTRQCKALQH